MELPSIAAPGVGEQADAVADAACHLYDTLAPWGAAAPGGWSRGAAEDAAEAIETAAHALAYAHPRAEVILGPVHTALADLRRQLGLAPAEALTAEGLPATPRTVGNPRRTRWVRVLTPPAPRQEPSRTTS
ncbi:hypothetical protein M8Z33_29620 [Streptomyces sp. ZAF1911]|uniref:hypothetical protein n=1 Tax=Streptomyces TaxID=1883 RepID=UPI0020308853|nr:MULTISPECIES: hypothetical protein [unclassified Streptomyces]MCM1967925.1 hypothetical protein [Streptomyces sp. G1]MCX5128301.1 hypothetical protein [Streptomyces sp. NBC_00347]MCX5300819.1 hypothetical protein [Streptomyces sp. NBC_00193]MDD9380738.1 hypothetical protein [Streptomyces sp. ZAF1911]